MATPTLVQSTRLEIVTLPASGVNVVLPAPATAGDALIAVVFGQADTNPLGQRTDTNPYFATSGNIPAPVFNDNQGNTWTIVKSLSMVDLVTGVGGAGTESDPDLSAEYPSVYIAAAVNVAANTQSLNVRANYLNQNTPWSSIVAYQVGDAVNVAGVVYVCNAAHTNHLPPNGSFWTVAASPSTDSRFAGSPGFPVFDGLNTVLLDFSGIVTAAAVDGTPVGASSTANPATAGAITTTLFGGLVIAVGLQKDSNQFSMPAGWTLAHQGKLVGSEEHFVIMYQLQGASSAATITNLALTSNVVTITAANHFFAGAQVTLAGLTTTPAINGTVLTVLAAGLSTTQFTANLTRANIGTASETGTATGFQGTVGAITPGFVNPVGRTASGFDIGPTTSAGYETIVVAAAFKHA